MNIPNEIIKHKKALNKIAEIGWTEIKTTKYIKEALPVKPIKTGFGGKDVGLLYKFGEGKKSILLRADIDALRTKKGVAHICGHSSHTSALMGVLLEIIKRKIPGNKSVYFLFQPAEETFPSGAKAFVDECSDIISSINYAFATHVRPKMKTALIGLQDGSIWARGDYMEIEIQGKMVHVKNTPEGIDAIEGAAQIILAIKKIQHDFKENLRINIGVIEGGRQPNAVADYATLRGDIRYKDEKVKEKIISIIKNEINKIEEKSKVKIKLNYYDGCPVVENNTKLTNKISSYLKEKTDFKIVSDSSLFSYGCEDFSFISEKVPSVYALIGTGDKYDIHEENCTISDEGTLAIYRYFNSVVEWWLSSR